MIPHIGRLNALVGTWLASPTQQNTQMNILDLLLIYSPQHLPMPTVCLSYFVSVTSLSSFTIPPPPSGAQTPKVLGLTMHMNSINCSTGVTQFTWVFLNVQIALLLVTNQWLGACMRAPPIQVRGRAWEPCVHFLFIDPFLSIYHLHRMHFQNTSFNDLHYIKSYNSFNACIVCCIILVLQALPCGWSQLTLATSAVTDGSIKHDYKILWFSPTYTANLSTQCTTC